MCGIAGIVGPDRELLSRALAAMIRAQRHRGPNDQGAEFLDAGPGTLALGHARLSILDLSMLGHQPMVHPGTGDVLVFNGEVYNFQELRRDLLAEGSAFRSHGDTEVLLHALTRWGPACLQRLEGMYALAFYRRHDRRLVLARDPLGIKPLYTAALPGGIAFASEVRAILATGLVERRPSIPGVAALLAYGSVPEPDTIIAGIQSFPPGCWQEIDLSGAWSPPPAPQRHWDFPAPRTNVNPADIVEQVRHTLGLAVRDHLVSDVPLGVFLSSGLDSTIVAALAAPRTRQLRTFTVGFADQADMSEATLAGGTARELGVNHTDISVNGSDALDLALAWLGALDQPSMDGLNVYIISKVVRDAGITVALSGQGGDELFGGYPSFVQVPRLRNALRLAKPLPAWLRSAGIQLAAAAAGGGGGGGAGGGGSAVRRQKLGDMARGPATLRAIYLHRRRAMSDGQLALLGIRAADLGLTPELLPAPALADLPAEGDDATALISRFECRFYLLNTLLRDGDANGMAHSLEIRVPFLDRRVIDLALSIPGHVRLPTRRADKHLLRQAFASHLRPELTRQSKRGFNLPIKRWLLGPLQDLARESLDHLKGLGFLRAQGVDAVMTAFRREPESPMWSRLWTLCVLGHYLRAPATPP